MEVIALCVLVSGCVAGDEETYDVFSPLFDPVISGRHGGYSKSDKHKTDLNAGGLRRGQLDSKYVLSCRVRTGRSIRGYCMPPHCTRAERRKVEMILVDTLKHLDDGGLFKGTFSHILILCLGNNSPSCGAADI